MAALSVAKRDFLPFVKCWLVQLGVGTWFRQYTQTHVGAISLAKEGLLSIKMTRVEKSMSTVVALQTMVQLESKVQSNNLFFQLFWINQTISNEWIIQWCRSPLDRSMDKCFQCYGCLFLVYNSLTSFFGCHGRDIGFASSQAWFQVHVGSDCCLGRCCTAGPTAVHEGKWRWMSGCIHCVVRW